MDDLLYQSVARTIAFFDIFDHPLTDRELFEYLHCPPVKPKLDFFDFILQLREFPHSSIGCTEGMWHLKGRESLVPKRTERSVYLDRKLKILARAARIMPYVPFVRAVFVCNTIAFQTPEKTSDIDIFIIVKFGRMWIARLCTTLVLSIVRLRRTRRYVSDRICLSFYLADRALNLSRFRVSSDDIYLSYWLRTLIPVYDPDQLGESILRANRELLAPFLSHARYIEPLLNLSLDRRVSKKSIARFIEYILCASLGTRVESIVRSFQRKKIMKNTKSLVHAKDTRVVVNDSVLKFHENDRRVLYRDLWKKKLRDLSLSEYV